MLELLDLRERGERLEAVRPEIDPTVSETVQRILQRVFVEGDEVLVELAQRFDDADLSEIGLMVRREEFAVAEHETPADLKRALDALIDRLRDLHARQLPSEWWEESDGVRYGEIVRPIRAVGCYVPGGRALYPSSVCMTVVPAVVAGVPEIVLCTPPRADGTIHPAVLYAAKRAGATYVAKTGGAQAIAAMAYGTETIPQVDRIVGPGNAYVTEAKRQLCGTVGIDALAGPSELAIVTDGDVDPELVALDLIAQAEHDPLARTYLITTDEAVIAKVGSALEQCVAEAGRREIVDAALGASRGVLVRDLEQAASVVDELAPEHLLILLADAEAFLETVSVAGAIFLGEWSAVPVRRLRRRVEPRAADVGDRTLLLRPARVRLRHGPIGRADVAHRRDAARAGRGGDRQRGGTRRPREGGGSSEGSRVNTSPSPRPGLREVGPYDSPQLEVAVRLNANECPLPLPASFSDDLAAAVRDLSLNRYPDGEMRELREALAARTGHPADGIWPANGSNEVLTQLLQAYGGPGRSAAVFEPTYVLAPAPLLAHADRARRTSPRSSVPDRGRGRRVGERRRRPTSCSCAPRTTRPAPLQPLDTIAALAGSDRRARDRRRGVRGLRRRERAAARGRSRQRRGRAHVLEVVRARRGADRLRPRVADGRGGPPARPAPVPPERAHAGGRRHGPPARGRGRGRASPRSASSGTGSSRRSRGSTARRSSRRRRTSSCSSRRVTRRRSGRRLLDRGVLVRDLTEVVPNALRVTAGTAHEVDLFLKSLEEVLA